MIRASLVLMLVLSAGPAMADAPAMALRPVLRPAPVADDGAIAPASASIQRPRLRPLTRPGLAVGTSTQPQARAEDNLFARSPYAPHQSGRPAMRPAVISQRAISQQQATRRGQICGDPAIQGEELPDIQGAGGCGVLGAVRVRSVAGITLTPNPTIDCNTAKALRSWVDRGIKPAVGDTGGGIASLRVVGHYSCRNRVGGSATNNKLSEHARGRAVDIGGIQLKSGRVLTVLTGWNKGAAGQQLKAMWRAACGPFGTVLGPAANAAHRDHFHVDTARYRSGTYCR